MTPLLSAARSGVVDTVRELLEHEADRNHSHLDVAGCSVLHYANSPAMIQFLLENDYIPTLDILKHKTM